MGLQLDDKDGFTRRKFLQVSAGTAAAMMVTALPNFSWAQALKVEKVGLEQCLSLTPLQMAKKSNLVQASYDYITGICGEITNQVLRDRVLQVIHNPAPTFMQRYTTSDAQKILWQKLVAAKYLSETIGVDDFLPPSENIQKASQPFYAAPGSGYMSHHAYPGGLATHTAFNIRSSLNVSQGYFETFDYKLDRDLIIAAQALHDLHKPWVFQWQEDGSCLKEITLAGQGAHHVLGIAESIYRGFPPDVVVAQACAHNHPGSEKDEVEVIEWIKAACIIADKDPIGEGLLSADGSTLPIPRRQENFVTHLGDHDWVLSGPAVKWTLPALKKIAQQEYKMNDQELNGKKFNALRNYVFSQFSAMRSYQVLATQGEAGLRAKVREMIG
ncbi:twin-arginine translocation signal domain-containing protein [Pelosinus baikalensis]|uniref:Twin-arginine translocation signal domain-containing protein n=1 Tax=Pelosinus baikalensis TaxID=2892015 RepID=A0ABS8I1B4_9FIRM|nr:twin-arginine translocation signal domain-containing protein [Pelosinus baikalensis]MCC5468279.1 twin-arginine translocation signal domain-containing protein [Pelosinus baikalensis]